MAIKFRYVAYNNAGVRQQGTIEASSEQDALLKLQAQQLSPVTVNEIQSATKALFEAKHLTLNDVEFFTSELALLLRSGLNIDRGLQLLAQNAQSEVFRQFAKAVYERLKRGEMLSDILKDYDVFSTLYIGLVKIAEETGELSAVFEKLSQEIKYQLELRAKVMQALTYPAVILFVCIGALLFIFNFVVPNMSSLFSEQPDLPGYTRALLGLSNFMIHYQWYLIIAVTLGLYSLWHQRQHPKVQELIVFCKVRVPLVNSAAMLLEQVRFNSALATMLSTGVSIDKALQLAINTLTVPTLQTEVRQALTGIKKGQGLADSLRQTRLYPPYFASLLAIGEESGELDRAFQEISDRSRTAFYQWVTRFTTLLEPLLILFMGAIVGSVVVIMMLSITAVTDMPV